MKKYFQCTKKTFVIFLALGVVIFIINFFIQIFWLRFFRFILNQLNLGYDFQPVILKYTKSFLAYSPWVIFGVVFIADILKRNFARSISFFLGIALVPVSFIGYISLGPIVSDYAQRTKFDSVSWKNEDLASNWKNPVRLRMVDDLLRKHKLIGMSKDQINELLSIPEPTGYFSNFDYVYYLGPERRFIRMDSEWLGVKFKNDIVIEARILRD